MNPRLGATMVPFTGWSCLFLLKFFEEVTVLLRNTISSPKVAFIKPGFTFSIRSVCKHRHTNPPPLPSVIFPAHPLLPAPTPPHPPKCTYIHTKFLSLITGIQPFPTWNEGYSSTPAILYRGIIINFYSLFTIGSWHFNYGGRTQTKHLFVKSETK